MLVDNQIYDSNGPTNNSTDNVNVLERLLPVMEILLNVEKFGKDLGLLCENLAIFKWKIDENIMEVYWKFDWNWAKLWWEFHENIIQWGFDDD